MKEQRITIEIDHQGQISAESEGFSGDTCLRELERLLEGLSPGTATLERKPDTSPARLKAAQTQTTGKKA
jgi:hypothetical protein